MIDVAILVDGNQDIADFPNIVTAAFHLRRRRCAEYLAMILADIGGGRQQVAIRLTVVMIPKIMNMPGKQGFHFVTFNQLQEPTAPGLRDIVVMLSFIRLRQVRWVMEEKE